MTVQLANNATSRLAGSITAASTAISVQAGDGAKYPALSGGDTFPVTLIKSDGQLEICRCTARTGDVLTVLRGQENTTAKAFAAGDRVELRITKGAWDEKFAPLEDIGFTVIYPGGNATTPGIINLNTVQIIDNPFPGFALYVVAEHRLDGQWFEAGWFSATDRVNMPSDPFNAWGLKAGHNLVTDKIIVRAGKNGTATDPAISGGSWTGGAWGQNQANAYFRIKVWKIKGKING